jgi:hypothetical protein
MVTHSTRTQSRGDVARRADLLRNTVPEIGQVVVNRPKPGRLSVYQKRDGSVGATVITLDDGRKRGVTPGVQKFHSMGTHQGWAYVDSLTTAVFLFKPGALHQPTKPMVAIQANAERIAVEDSKAEELSQCDGQWVAFHAQVTGRTAMNRPKRTATDILPIDAHHPLLLADLIRAGQIASSAHDVVIELFLEALNAFVPTGTDKALIDSALSRLAADVAVPQPLQLMARVQRSKLTSGHGKQTSFPQPPPISAHETVSQPLPAHQPIVADADVQRLNLNLD